MALSSPMKLTSSASFSPSIRISLRLKIHQAQAKNFCRVLDIRVTQIVKANVLKAIFLKYLLMFFRNIIRAVRLAVFEIEFNIFFTKKLSIFYFISF